MGLAWSAGPPSASQARRRPCAGGPRKRLQRASPGPWEDFPRTSRGPPLGASPGRASQESQVLRESLPRAGISFSSSFRAMPNRWIALPVSVGVSQRGALLESSGGQTPSGRLCVKNSDNPDHERNGHGLPIYLLYIIVICIIIIIIHMTENPRGMEWYSLTF